MKSPLPAPARLFAALGKPTTKPQFAHQPTRPAARSECLQYLPPAPFTLTIISLSYNRPSVHTLLSAHFPMGKSIRYPEPNGWFLLTAIPQRFVDLSQPIPAHIRTLSSCFSKEDQQRWIERRKEKRNQSKKPCHQLRLTFSLRIKHLHKSSLIRKTIRKRWIAALKLIVQYGAHLSTTPNSDTQKVHNNDVDKGGDQIKLDPKQAGFHKWLDPSYYYILHPTLALNTIGLPHLVHAIRLALETIQKSIRNLPPQHDPRATRSVLPPPPPPQQHHQKATPSTSNSSSSPSSFPRQNQPSYPSPSRHLAPVRPPHRQQNSSPPNKPSSSTTTRPSSPPRKLALP
ncbi:hypothetical protein PCASD_15309 [Puccinia coronata f. sp. avenae]|uniref:Uncharacterized protein n=1 Tax=Puccinia coronata f. sp. avenae TaxID=200324 RepID=A0A2N5T9Y1_9BASI|nr:hypothetical protein PCASD_15309 [Puccinia coronata f. sp. avenae]